MNIYDQLRRDEGVKPFPYTDTVGKISIGCGRNLTDVGLSDPEIDMLLQDDVNGITATLAARLPYWIELDPVRQGVLINMGFNLGFAGLEKFPVMLSAVAKGDWAEASKQMLNSRWATQVGGRAQRLAIQMQTGEWQ